MNLVKAAELLKGAPENTLKQYLANPNGEFPEYLVASEIARREDMRKRYASEMGGQPPKTSIIQELLQRDNASLRTPQPQTPSPAMQPPAMQPPMLPQAQGIGSVPPPPDMQLNPAPIVDAAQQPQQFAGGGAVAFADGGLTNLAEQMHNYLSYAKGGPIHYAVGGGTYSLSPELMGDLQKSTAAPQDLNYWRDQAKEMLGSSGLEGWQDVLKSQKEEIAGREKNYLPNFLITAGLGMAASKSPHALQAAAEGALQGFGYHEKAKAADEAARRNLTESQFKFQQAERAERAGLLNISQSMYANAMNQYQAGLKNRVDAEQSAIAGQHYKDVAKYYSDKNNIDSRQVANQAANLALQREEQKQYHEGILEDRKLGRRLEASKVRDSLVNRRLKLQEALDMPGGEFQQRVATLKKQYKDPYALDRAISDLRKSYEKQVGITELENALAEYNK